MSEMIERVARALASSHGDNWDDIPGSKSNWVEMRGQFGGRFRDVNENFRCDYLDQARAAIETMRAPTPQMLDCSEPFEYTMPQAELKVMTDTATKYGIWQDMIDKALQ